MYFSKRCVYLLCPEQVATCRSLPGNFYPLLSVGLVSNLADGDHLIRHIDSQLYSSSALRKIMRAKSAIREVFPDLPFQGIAPGNPHQIGCVIRYSRARLLLQLAFCASHFRHSRGPTPSVKNEVGSPIQFDAVIQVINQVYQPMVLDSVAWGIFR